MESKQSAQIEPLTSRGEKLSDLRRAARLWAGWESPEAIAADEISSAEKTDASPQAGQ